MTTALQRQEPGDPRAKAIEAMARGMAAVTGDDWDDLDSAGRTDCRADAEAVLAALEAEGWGLTSMREGERLRDGIEVALANVKAAHDPKVDGHLGLLLNAESILRSLIGEAEATPPAREAEKPCETCEGRGQIRRFFDSRPAIVPCPSCGGSGRTETKP